MSEDCSYELFLLQCPCSLMKFTVCVRACVCMSMIPNFQVLCASNEDHTVVEPLLPPEGAKIGERVSFSE